VNVSFVEEIVDPVVPLSRPHWGWLTSTQDSNNNSIDLLLVML